MYVDKPAKALAYILLVLLLPIIGAVLYFSIGVNYRKEKYFDAKILTNDQVFEEARLRLLEHSSELIDKVQLGRYSKLAKFTNIHSFTSYNNRVKLLINGENKFPDLLEAIANAKNHVHIEYYIFENDDIGNKIAEALMAKAREGVKVRLIYDDFGSSSIRKKFVKRLSEAGVEAFAFYKLKLVKLANRMNYRNHRKIVVIDGIIGYVGGINVGDGYVNNGKKDLYWRDTHVRIEGLSVWNLQYIFLTDWNFASKQDLKINNDFFPIQKEKEFFGKTLVQVISSGPDSDLPNIRYSIVRGIMSAKNRICITTPYFIPDSSIIDALITARLSGVHVQLMIPGISDSKFVNLVSCSYYDDLLREGVEIFKYQKGFIHAKTMILDDQVGFVGTANLDNRSFELNFEVNSIIYDNDFAKQMINQFELDKKDCEQLHFEEWNDRSVFIKLAERACRLSSPLL